MLALKLTRFHLQKGNGNIKSIIFRGFNSQNKDATTAVRRSFRSKIVEGVNTQSSSFATPNLMPLKLGHGLLAGASVVGLGSLAYYGLFSSRQGSILEKKDIWPQFVRERIRQTYEYFGASLGITAASVYGISKSPQLMRLLTGHSIMAVFASMALLVGSSVVVRSIPYEQTGTKHLAWLAHIALLGAIIAPLSLLGGPLLIRAGWYTGGIVSGLSIVAASAPSEKFLNMTGPLAIGLGAVFAASVGGMFLPPTTTLGLSLYSISLYGGLVLFSMFLLHDTQRIVHKAEQSHVYDPINESMSIYMDTINIFIRIATILSGGGNKRK